MGYIRHMSWLLLLSCLPSGVQLTGVAEVPGDPSAFIQLCETSDPTAVAIKEASGKSDCVAAGQSVIGVDTIDFNRSSLEKVNLHALALLTNLKSIAAYERQIDDITPLAGLVRLEELYLMQNDIVDITPLSMLFQLKYLRLDGNNIVDISVLSKLKKLEKLGLDANQIKDFQPLAELPILQDLNTNFNPVDLDKCPEGEGVTKKLNKYCKRMKKNAPDIQGAIDPK